MFAIGDAVRVGYVGHEAHGACGVVVRAERDEVGVRYLVNFETMFGEYADWFRDDTVFNNVMEMG